MKIGIIGLGAMGGQIALQLVRSGHQVTVWNRTRSAVIPLLSAGATGAVDVSDALQGDVALTILFDDASIRETLLQTDALKRAKRACIHACMATISMAFANEFAELHRQFGLQYAATPMLGRPDVIEKRGLNVLAAGEASILDVLETPFAHLGKMWRLGPKPTNANIAKLTANFMIAGAIEAMSEAAAVINAYGADSEQFLATMSETLFSAPIYRVYAPIVSGHAPAAPSGLAMPLKAIGNTLAAAQTAAVSVPLGETIRTNLSRASKTGYADKDWATALAEVARLRKI